MTCLVVADFTFKEEEADNMADRWRTLFPDTRGYPGCIDLSVSRNQDDPNKFVIIVVWESREQAENYLNWRSDRGDLENYSKWVTEEPTIRFFNKLGL